MTSASSRRSFYPLPPSQYPQPLVQPCAALETTYAHNHCSHSVRDSEFFRSRTLHPASSAAQPPFAPEPTLAAAPQGIYPRHGIGQFVAPYYRRDSKGYRRPYTQPPAVDEQYSATRDLSGLAQSGFQWAHPSSRPGNAASKSSAAAAGGAVFGTTYRNSGLYDASMAYTSRPARQVADGLQQARSNAGTTSLASTQPLSASFSASSPGRAQASSPSAAAGPARTAFASSYASLGPSLTGRAVADQSSAAGMEGYYTGEVADQPPPGAEILIEDDEQAMQQQQQLEQQWASGDSPLGRSGGAAASRVFEDPLLPDPLDNAIRKPRTVYQRAYGRCH